MFDSIVCYCLQRISYLFKLFCLYFSHLLQSSFSINISIILNDIPWINFLNFGLM